MNIYYPSADTRTKIFVKFLIDNYNFYTDLPIDNTALKDMYIIEDNKKVYIYDMIGWAQYDFTKSSHPIVGYDFYIRFNK